MNQNSDVGNFHGTPYLPSWPVLGVCTYVHLRFSSRTLRGLDPTSKDGEFYFGWKTGSSAPIDLTAQEAKPPEDPGWGPRCPSSGGGTLSVPRRMWGSEMSPKFSMRQD